MTTRALGQPVRPLGRPVTVMVTQARLAELEAKERAHDVYLIACQAMGRRLAALESLTATTWLNGYRRAISDFDWEVATADAEAGARLDG